MLEARSDRLYIQFAREERLRPSDRKYITGSPLPYSIYRQRPLPWKNCLGSDRHRLGNPLLGNLEEAMFVADAECCSRTTIQPRCYRAPEVVLNMPIGPPVDIWNLACMMASVVRENDSELPLLHKLGPNWSEGIHLYKIAQTLGMPTPEIAREAGRFERSGFDRNGMFVLR
jgi:serine/threonine protein kinase